MHIFNNNCIHFIITDQNPSNLYPSAVNQTGPIIMEMETVGESSRSHRLAIRTTVRPAFAFQVRVRFVQNNESFGWPNWTEEITSWNDGLISQLVELPVRREQTWFVRGDALSHWVSDSGHLFAGGMTRVHPRKHRGCWYPDAMVQAHWALHPDISGYPVSSELYAWAVLCAHAHATQPHSPLRHRLLKEESQIWMGSWHTAC